MMNTVVLSVSVVKLQMSEHRFIVVSSMLLFRLEASVGVVELVFVTQRFLKRHLITNTYLLRYIHECDFFFGRVRFVRFDPRWTDSSPAVHLLQVLQMSLGVVDFVSVVLVAQMMNLVLVILHSRVHVKRLVHFRFQLAERLP